MNNFQPLTADSRQLRGLKSSVGTLGTSLSMSRHFTSQIRAHFRVGGAQ